MVRLVIYVINLPLKLFVQKFRHNIVKFIVLLLALVSFSACEDTGCISADDFGGTYVDVNSNPETVYGNYPNQSTDWIETGLRSSGGPMRIAISGGWVPWSLVATSTSSLASLQSCFDTRNFDPTDDSSSNMGLCAKRVPIDTSVTPNILKTGIDRINDLNSQNCICYEGETPVGMPNAARDGIVSPPASCNTPSASNVGNSDSCSCQKINDLPNGKPATEDYCVFHYTLVDKMKMFHNGTDLDPLTGNPGSVPVPNHAEFGNPRMKPAYQQGSVCKFEKGMGLYMGFFGPNGNRQPLRIYHLFTQEEECPITRDSSGRCIQTTSAGTVDRTRFIYTTDGPPVYDDKSGNDCSDTDPSDDEMHRMREVIKLKLHDSYYRDNYGTYKVEFLSGVYSNDDVLIMEHIVNLIEEVLIGRLDITTGAREGGILRFLYNSIVTDQDFILIVKLMLILYITSFGLTSLLGLVEMSRKEIFVRIFQIGIIFFFTSADGWQAYNDYVVSFFKNSMDQIINRITLYANQFLLEGETTTNAIRNAQLRSTNPDLMGAKFAYIDLVIRTLFSEAVTKKIWSLFFYDFFGFLYIFLIYMLIFYFLFTMGIVVFIYCVTLTKMIIGLALGPVFITFILFKQTNEYFKKWLTFIAARSLEMLILFLLVFVFVVLIDRKFNELLYYSACIVEWDLWLFKFKWLVAQDVHTISSTGSSTGLSRSLTDWFLMLVNVLLIIYMTKVIIGQIPALAGKLISIGGVANQASGGSGASSAFNLGNSIAGEIFGGAAKMATRAAAKTGGLAFRGSRQLLQNAAPLRALGYGLDKIGRERIRNNIIDGSIKKATQLSDAKGLTGKDRDEFIRNHVMSEPFKAAQGKDKSQGGLRDWASQNPNSAGLLNINSDTIAKRLDKKLLKEPMKKAMKEKAQELKSGDPSKVPLGSEIKAEMEKAARDWAAKNSSQSMSHVDNVLEKYKNKKGFVGSRGGWRPRRVNLFDEMSKMHYQEASKESAFGGSDAAKEKYLKHLKDRQFEKLKKSSKFDDKFVATAGSVTKESKGFLRRAHDRQNYDPRKARRFGREGGRAAVNQELKDLEYSAVRKSLMGSDFRDEKSRLDAKYSKDSAEGQRAEFYGKVYQRQLEEKRKQEERDIDQKRRFFMKSLESKVVGDVKGFQKNATPEQEGKLRKDLLKAHDDIINNYKNMMASRSGSTIDPQNMADGLLNARLSSDLEVGGKKYSELSLFEVKAMLNSIGGLSDSLESFSPKEAAAKLQSLKQEQEKEAAKLKDIEKLAEEKNSKAAALEESAKNTKAAIDALGDAQSSQKASELERKISDYRASVAGLSGDINAMNMAMNDLEIAMRDPNISSSQYNEIALMISNIRDEQMRQRMLDDYQTMQGKMNSGDYNNEQLHLEFLRRAEEATAESQRQLDSTKVDIIDQINQFDAQISGNEATSQSIEALRESVGEFDQANQKYDESYKETLKSEVIVKDFEIEFGRSLSSALSVGTDDALMKAADLSVGGSQSAQSEMADTTLLTNAQMALSQHKHKIKVNKNKMSHLEYEKSNLEREKSSCKDSAKAAEIQSQINSLDSEIGSLKRDNAMESSRVSEVEFRVSELTANTGIT